MTTRQDIASTAAAFLGYLAGTGYNQPNQFSQDLGRPAEAWCFAAGTLITTPDGLVDIADLEVDDKVLSASGSIRAIERVMTHDAENVVILKALGLDGTVTTADHPYLARRCHGRPGSRRWDDASWIAAADLRRGDLIAVPRPVAGTAEFDEHQAYIVGRWLADGWVTMKKSHSSERMFPRWFICSSHDEADGLAKALTLAGVTAWRRSYPTSEQFAIPLGPITAVLSEGGAYAHGKRLPGCVMSWSESARRAVLNGYLDGDGTSSPQEGIFARATTASRSLAYGVACLARSLGYVASVYYYGRQSEHEWIEGRLVTVHGRFDVHIRHAAIAKGQVISESDQDWVPVRSVVPADPRPVYNLTVADEHTFIADGVAVHNCGDFVTDIWKRANLLLPSMQAGCSTGYAYCPDAVNWGKAHGIARPSWAAEPGDIVLFDWNGDGVSDHTEIVVATAPGSITTVGGNSGPGGGVNQHVWNTSPPNGNNLILITLNTAMFLGLAPAPSGSPITMYDSVTASDIPSGAVAISGYTTGGSGIQWSDADWAMFPNAIKVRTAQHADGDGDELDVESGAASPNEVPGWCQRQFARGLTMVSVYVQLSRYQEVVNVVDGAGLHDNVVYRLAEWNGSPHLTGVAREWACQYADPSNGANGHFDLSYCSDFSWMGRSPAPTPGPAPAPPGPGPAFPGRLLMLKTPMMSGGDVGQWQQKMKDRGWGMGVDTWYGQQSRGLCLQFQQECNAQGHDTGGIDGVVGEKTWDLTWSKPIT